MDLNELKLNISNRLKNNDRATEKVMNDNAQLLKKIEAAEQHMKALEERVDKKIEVITEILQIFANTPPVKIPRN